MVQKLVDTSGLLRTELLDRVFQTHGLDEVRPAKDGKKDREEQEEQRRDRFERGYVEVERPLWQDSQGEGEERPSRQDQGEERAAVSTGRQLELPGMERVTLGRRVPETTEQAGGTLDLEA